MLNSIVVKLLNDNGKVSLPSIGIFVKIEVDDAAAYLFTPSAAKVDSGMVELVMAEMDVRRDDAVNIITSYADFIKNIIAKNGKYPLKGIGDIKCNEQGTYYFVPFTLEVQVETEPKRQELEIVEPKVAVNEIKEVETKEEKIVEIGIEEQVVASEEVKEQEEIKKDEQTRLNERFESRRLGEIIDGGANRRFYDKVHSQVVAKSVDEIVKDSLTVERIIEEAKQQNNVPVETDIKEQITAENISEIKKDEAVVSDNVLTQQPARELSQDVLKEMLGHSKRSGLYEIYDKGAKTISKPAETVVKQEVVTPVVTPPVYTPVQIPAPEVPKYVEEQQQEPQPKKKVDLVLIVSLIVIVVGIGVIAYFYYMQKELGL